MQGTYFDDCVQRMELKSCAVHPTPLGLLVHIDLDLSDIKHGRVTGSSFGLILILGAPSHLANVCHGPGISGRPPRTAAVTPETLPNLRRWGFLLCVCVCVCVLKRELERCKQQTSTQAGPTTTRPANCMFNKFLPYRSRSGSDSDYAVSHPKAFLPACSLKGVIACHPQKPRPFVRNSRTKVDLHV